MSNQQRVTNRPVHQKFCKVCQDAGKTLAEYTSHNVRDTKSPSSHVTCPTLLAQECRFCFNKGHSLKYCPQIKKKEAEAAVRTVSAPVTKQAFKAPTNVFAMLSNSDSEEEEGEVKEEPTAMPMPIAMGLSCQKIAPMWPALSRTSSSSAASWSSGAKRVDFGKLIATFKEAPAKAKVVEAPGEPVVIKIKSVVLKGKWADCDSDEEDEFYSEYDKQV
jgi:hypothetical protein